MFFRAKKDDNAKDKVFRDLKVTYPSLRQQATDPNTWDLDFQAAYQNCALKITFPASYPNDPPTLQVFGSIQHPLLDGFKRVRHPHLQRWDRQQPLVTIIQDTITQLQSSGSATTTAAASGFRPAVPSPQVYGTHPTAAASAAGYPPIGMASPSVLGAPATTTTAAATVMHQPSPSYATYAPAGGYPAMQAAATYPFAQEPPPPSYTTVVGGRTTDARPQPVPQALPATRQYSDKTGTIIPQSFPELERMSDIQLRRLLEDDIAMKTHLAQMQEVKDMRSVRDDLRAANLAAARSNLAQEEELGVLYSEVLVLQNQLRAARADYEQEYAALRSMHSVDVNDVIGKIRRAVDDLDRTSEDLATSFTRGEKDLASFLTEYPEMRKRYHTQQAKLTRMQMK